MLDAAGVAEPERRARLDALLAEDHELPAVLHALDGGYLRPAPGGDLLRTAEVLPTGRNLHGFDPFRIPSAFAVQDGARQAERLLARDVGGGARTQRGQLRLHQLGPSGDLRPQASARCP